LNEFHQLLGYSDNANILDEYKNTMTKNREDFLDGSRTFGIERNTDSIWISLVIK